MLLRQLEYFQAVVENGSFYTSAEKCHVSQSAISQQIKKLEADLGVLLLKRHNRTYSLTEAGEHFYRKSLIIRSELEQLIKETQRLDGNDSFILRLGCYKGYHGSAFSHAIALFSAEYPKISIKVTLGSHEELYHAMEAGAIDLALNDQRRAFSGTYNNIILAESKTYIEISARNPLSHLHEIEIHELKNLPCIVLSNGTDKQEEEAYYTNIVGLQGDYLFASSLEEARLMIITGQGYMPVDIIGKEEPANSAIARLPLVRRSEAVSKTYCAFWKKDNSGYYIEEFADMLKESFAISSKE